MLFRSILLLTLPAVFLSTEDTRNVPFLETDPEAGRAQPPAQEEAAGQAQDLEAGQAQPPAQEEAVGQPQDLEAGQPQAQQPAIQRMMNAIRPTCEQMGNAIQPACQRMGDAMRDQQNRDRVKAACSYASIGCGSTTCLTCCCACIPCSSVEACALCGAAAGAGVAHRTGYPQPNCGRFTKPVLCTFSFIAVVLGGSQVLDWFKGPPKIKFVDEKSNSFGIWHDKDDTTHPSGKMPSVVSWMMGVGDQCAWMPSGMYPGMDDMQTLSVQTPTVVSANPTKGGSFTEFLRPVTFIRKFRTPFEDYGKHKANMVIGNLESINKGTKLPQVIIGDNGQGDAFWAARVIEKFPKQAVGFINMVTDKPTIPIEEDKLGVMSNESTPEMGKIYVYTNPGHLAIMARKLKLINETQFEAFHNHFLDELKQLPVEKQKDMLSGNCKRFKLDSLSEKMKSQIDFLNAEQKKCLPEEMKSFME